MDALKVSNISKSFPAEGGQPVDALVDFSLSVREREVMALVGPNGSGKSTLLEIISGHLRPDYGQVFLGGEDVSGWSWRRRALKLGRLYQNARLNILPCYTVQSNLLIADLKGGSASWVRRLGDAGREERVRAEVKEVAPELLDRWGVEAGRLSGGELQLLGLCATILRRPKVLLLDEHAASLDPRNAQMIIERTRQYADQEGRGALLVGHQIGMIFEVASRVCMIENGRLRGVVKATEAGRQMIVEFFSGAVTGRA